MMDSTTEKQTSAPQPTPKTTAIEENTGAHQNIEASHGANHQKNGVPS
jgi:hypothetical protein